MTTMTENVDTGWTDADGAHEALLHRLDEYRFANDGDKALALFEGDEGHSLFPDPETMVGVDLNDLLARFEAGFHPELFGFLYEVLDREALAAAMDGLNQDHVDVALSLGFAPDASFAELVNDEGVEFANGALEHFIDAKRKAA